MIDFQYILNELSYRVGVVNLKSRRHLEELQKVLSELNYPSDWIYEFISEVAADRKEKTPNQKKAKDDEFTHLGRGVYAKKSQANSENPQKFKKQDDRYIRLSDDEANSLLGKSEEPKSAEQPQQQPIQQQQPVQQQQPKQYKPVPPEDFKLDGEGETKVDFELPKDDEYATGEKEEKSAKRVVNGKTKTLEQDVNPLESSIFKSDEILSDKKFDRTNRKYQNPEPPPLYSIPESIKSNAKVPKKYLDVLERMMRTELTSNTSKLSHFSATSGGAGIISSQAGELMTLVATTMDTKDANAFFNSLKKYETDLLEADKKEVDKGLSRFYTKTGKLKKNRIIDSSWITAAKQNRKAILKRMKKQYGEFEIQAGAWDNESDFTALGGSNYSENKGHSTDIMFRVKDKDGNYMLDEVSLKKSAKINFLNSGLGKFKEWHPDIPDNINQNVYRSNQRESLVNAIKDNSDAFYEKVMSVPKYARKVRQIERKTGVSVNEALADKASSSAKGKVIRQVIDVMAEAGISEAKQFISNQEKTYRKFQLDGINEIIHNKEMKSGMMDTISSQLPIKAVITGEESLAIGNLSFDKEVAKEIFKTDNFKEIEERLVAEKGNPPYIAYDVDGKKKIGIAHIYIREDGVGYSGKFKFEMLMNPEFTEELQKANKKVYGDS